MSDRRDHILSAALGLFNQHGIDGVKTRDIAAEIGISLGNLTYYFPAKNDIVLALAHNLGDAINEALAQTNAGSGSGKNTLVQHYHQVKTVFTAHLEYRFLFGRWGEIVCSAPEVQQYAQGILKLRFVAWKHLNEQLVSEGLAEPALAEDSHAHSYIINILALFWHQEFDIYFPGISDEQKISKALAVYFQSYKPYLTAKGREALLPLLEKLDPY